MKITHVKAALKCSGCTVAAAIIFGLHDPLRVEAAGGRHLRLVRSGLRQEREVTDWLFGADLILDLVVGSLRLSPRLGQGP
jgi:hypothetical protein